MTKKQRNLLSRTMSACNDLGGNLDYSSTNIVKLMDRQKAHMLVYNVIYGVFGDDPQNDQRFYDLEMAETNLIELEQLRGKSYPDKNGYFKKEELTAK